MKKRVSGSFALVIVFAAVMWSFGAVADTKSYNISTAALESGAPDNPDGPPPASDYATGFEAGDGFAPGYCGGQAGWTAFAVSTTEGHIDTANPADGDQHIRISEDATILIGSTTGCFSPDLGVQADTPSLVSVDIAIGGAFGADYDVVPQAPSQMFLTARVKFSFLGDILILDDIGGGVLDFVDTGVDWDIGPYRNLRIEVDPGDDTIFYYYDDVLIHSSAGGVFAGTRIEQLVLLSDNFHLGESGDFDNVDIQNDIVVEPSEFARFLVTKDFNDNNTAEVEVTLSCNTGLPLEQTTSISEGDPVNFVVGDFEQGALDCEITEDVPEGYIPFYDSPDNVGDPSVSCALVDLIGAQYLCEITNELEEVEIEVTKVWIDENPQFNGQNIAEASWSCSNVAFPCANGFANDCNNGNLDFFGNPGVDGFTVFPDWEDGTICSVTEVGLFEGGVEVDDSECQGLLVFPGTGASCTIYNTRLYEGIPTLSQYGMGILALLMLGVGLVAFRRVI